MRPTSEVIICPACHQPVGLKKRSTYQGRTWHTRCLEDFLRKCGVAKTAPRYVEHYGENETGGPLS